MTGLVACHWQKLSVCVVRSFAFFVCFDYALAQRASLPGSSKAGMSAAGAPGAFAT